MRQDRALLGATNGKGRIETDQHSVLKLGEVKDCLFQSCKWAESLHPNSKT